MNAARQLTPHIMITFGDGCYPSLVDSLNTTPLSLIYGKFGSLENKPARTVEEKYTGMGGSVFT